MSVYDEGPLHIFSPPLYFRPAGKLSVHEYDFSSVVIVSLANEKAMREVANTAEEKDKLLISLRKHMLLICTCGDEKKSSSVNHSVIVRGYPSTR